MGRSSSTDNERTDGQTYRDTHRKAGRQTGCQIDKTGKQIQTGKTTVQILQLAVLVLGNESRTGKKKLSVEAICPKSGSQTITCSAFLDSGIVTNPNEKCGRISTNKEKCAPVWIISWLALRVAATPCTAVLAVFTVLSQ